METIQKLFPGLSRGRGRGSTYEGAFPSIGRGRGRGSVYARERPGASPGHVGIFRMDTPDHTLEECANVFACRCHVPPLTIRLPDVVDDGRPMRPPRGVSRREVSVPPRDSPGMSQADARAMVRSARGAVAAAEEILGLAWLRYASALREAEFVHEMEEEEAVEIDEMEMVD